MQYHNDENTYKMGIDIGSTTVKVVLADEENKLHFPDTEDTFRKSKRQ